MAATAELETLAVETSSPAMPRDEARSYEFVDGRWIEMPSMSYFAIRVANRLGRYLNSHIEVQTPCPGEVFVEMLFHIPVAKDAGRKRRPDLAFVSSERWPIDRPASLREDAWDVVPDLAVEVVSPSDFAEDLLGKVNEYFRAGVRLVWVVYPIRRCIHVFEASDRIRVLIESDSLDGGEVLPGFQHALDRLFGPVADENGKDAPSD